LHVEATRGRVGYHLYAERRQRFVHVVRVIGEERLCDLGAPFGQRGDEQGAVAVALRTGER
jgi:hypothetical protein